MSTSFLICRLDNANTFLYIIFEPNNRRNRIFYFSNRMSCYVYHTVFKFIYLTLNYTRHYIQYLFGSMSRLNGMSNRFETYKITKCVCHHSFIIYDALFLNESQQLLLVILIE
ncbi:hypothetical protein A8E81_10850 [Burkholderia cenocepacia]|nr:hypothetical protein A8E75_30755 [Burkholderia cenocepacia]ONV25314.1 hypothetical protein A8E74_09835 [Burkholderia cenocepacia]ONV30562.1 hypothetical protein A8E78_17290 [Burkholderia cenocepacia]ONV33477.1 hypothetical protein A8E77_16000 [Burkholderia cenocepacia]ONV40585.1 hypothetical protein A8E82_19710 [Burkholderia cenocepacia]